jgi:hypothetical protein
MSLIDEIDLTAEHQVATTMKNLNASLSEFGAREGYPFL